MVIEKRLGAHWFWPRLVREALRKADNKLFNSETVGTLLHEHDVRARWLERPIGTILNAAAADYELAKLQSSRDRKTARNELSEIAKKARSLEEKLGNAGRDTRYYLDAAFCSQNQKGTPRITVRKTIGAPTEFARTHIEELIETLEEAVLSAKRQSKADEDLAGLVLAAQLVWTRILGRRFTLVWTSTNEPVSEAAVWCRDVVYIADNEINPSRIRTAARKSQESLRNIRDLRGPRRFLAAYFKRSR